MKNPEFIMYTAPVSPSYLADIRRKFYFVDYHLPAVYTNLSRYRDIRTIKLSEDNNLIHETFYDYKIVESDNDKYYTVGRNEVGRIDIISLLAYKTSQYWWIIALANNIIDPFEEITEGTILRIPNIMSIYNSGSIFG